MGKEKMYVLQVPFLNKEEAKGYGARWYPAGKYWYYKGESLPEGLRRWYLQNDDEPEDEEQGSSDEMSAPAFTGKKAAFDQEQYIGDNPFSEMNEDASAKNYDEGPDSDKDPYAGYMTVSEANKMIMEYVDGNVAFRRVLVKGEVTNYDGRNGKHYYFSIKDKEALLPCILWEGTASYALKFKLEKGQQVAIVGKLEYYEPNGRLQLIVSEIVNIGEGLANLALLELKKKLEAEGLFDAARKKAIPKHPEQVGIITSKDGQAIKDICKVAKKRNPYVRLVLYHVNVQGVNAVPTILKGIKELDKLGLDSIIIGRGGGSGEELNVYNDEKIARAVAAAVTPIVSAVGHEGHWTMIDYVADKRVATPSEAAEETVPDVMADISRIQLLAKAISDKMAAILKNRKLLLESRFARIEKNSPSNKLKEKNERLNHLSEMLELSIRNNCHKTKSRVQLLSDSIDGNIRLIYQRYKDKPLEYLERIRNNVNQAFDIKNHRFELLLATLNGLSPTAKLVGGFGYVSKDGKPVTSVKLVEPGDDVVIRLSDGEIEANVTGRKEKS